MKYAVELSRSARRFILKQEQSQRRRILEALAKLPDFGDIAQLQGYEGMYRLRVGSYRAVYEVDRGKLLVLVLEIGNRGDVYK